MCVRCFFLWVTHGPPVGRHHHSVGAATALRQVRKELMWALHAEVRSGSSNLVITTVRDLLLQQLCAFVLCSLTTFRCRLLRRCRRCTAGVSVWL